MTKRKKQFCQFTPHQNGKIQEINNCEKVNNAEDKTFYRVHGITDKL